MRDNKELQQDLSHVHTLLHEFPELPKKAQEHLAKAIKEVESVEHIVMDMAEKEKRYKEVDPKKFPRGLESWLETHFQVVQYMGYRQYESTLIKRLDGENGKQVFAEELTTEFETIHKCTDFVNNPNGSFYDILDKFLESKI